MNKETILAALYDRLQGMTFTARNIGNFTMETGQERTALEIEDSAMIATLRQIRREVSQQMGNDSNIWKAITGPEDGYENYWLWVTPLSLQESGFYTVTTIETFGINPKYEAGVSITVRDQ